MKIYITGKIIKVNEKNVSVLIENNFMGYYIECSSVKGYETDSYAKIFTYEYKPMNQESKLFGFTRWAELIMFKKIISIKSMGPISAMKLLRIVGFKNLSEIFANDAFEELSKYGISHKNISLLKEGMDWTISYADSTNFKNEKRTQEKKHKVIDALTKIGYKKQEIENTIKDIDLKKFTEEEIVKKAIIGINNE